MFVATICSRLPSPGFRELVPPAERVRAPRAESGEQTTNTLPVSPGTVRRKSPVVFSRTLSQSPCTETLLRHRHRSHDSPRMLADNVAGCWIVLCFRKSSLHFPTYPRVGRLRPNSWEARSGEHLARFEKGQSSAPVDARFPAASRAELDSSVSRNCEKCGATIRLNFLRS